MTPEEIQAILDRYTPLPQGPVPQDSLAGRVGKWAFGPMVQTPRDRLVQQVNTRAMIEEYLNKSELAKAGTPAKVAEFNFDEDRAKADRANLPAANRVRSLAQGDAISRLHQNYGGPVEVGDGGALRRPRSIVPQQDSYEKDPQAFLQRNNLSMDLPDDQQMIEQQAGGEAVMPQTESQRRLAEYESQFGKVTDPAFRKKIAGFPLSQEELDAQSERASDAEINRLEKRAVKMGELLKKFDPRTMEATLGRNLYNDQAGQARGQGNDVLTKLYVEGAQKMMEGINWSMMNGNEKEAALDEYDRFFAKRVSRFSGASVGQAEPQAAPSGGQRARELDAETARQYLQRAGGDKDKARSMAVNDGFTIPQRATTKPTPAPQLSIPSVSTNAMQGVDVSAQQSNAPTTGAPAWTAQPGQPAIQLTPYEESWLRTFMQRGGSREEGIAFLLEQRPKPQQPPPSLIGGIR